MANSTTITMRIDSDDKLRAEKLFNSLGMNMTTAFNMFIKQVLICEGLPFEVSLKGSDEYFYSAANRAHLDKSIEQYRAHRTSTHELIEVDDE